MGNALRLPPSVLMDTPDPHKLIELGLLDHAADGHLRNWAEWTLAYRAQPRGYDSHSAVVRSVASSSLDEMLDRMDSNNARVCDAIIDSMTPRQQSAIHNVYIADVWKFRGSDTVQVFIDAAAEFWRVAQRRGLS